MRTLRPAVLAVVLSWTATLAHAQTGTAARPAAARSPACDDDNGGLVLPDGFCAVTVATKLGRVRQLVVAPNGDLYAALSGVAGDGSGGVLAFRDRDGDGHPDERASFGPRGGNDVKIHDGHLYFALNDRIIRWPLGGALEPGGDGDVIVADLPADGGHVAKSLAFDGDVMYVNVGSKTNSCQKTDRLTGSPGHDPCGELARRAGVWVFAAGRAGQTFADGRRYATGLRNAMALAIQPGAKRLWAGVHGRDMLSQNWGFSNEVNAENPAEEFVRVSEGEDYGWPYCFYSNQYRAKVLAPDYGGDGRRTDRCADRAKPVIAFPGHWAPMALVFYPDTAFGARYRGGAFLAFHGSWNREPLPQAGYRVVFIPFAGGTPSGAYETFATGKSATSLRASGVAVSADGSLFVADDHAGTIWKIMRR